jgi:AcrR family transcriptional regulator
MSVENASEGTPRLSRGRVVEAALDLVEREGLDTLTMRALAGELGVRAASLYWHVRDRRELVELLAGALLGEARPRLTGDGWRADALAACAALQEVAAGRRDAPRILLEAPGAVERSDAQARLRAVLEAAGLAPEEAHEAATMMLVHVLTGATRTAGQPVVEPGQPVLVAVDTGSRGVTIRAGADVAGLFDVPAGAGSASPAVVREDRVVVRRLRGTRHGEVRLNPAHPWRVRVQAPTWSTLLDLAGLDVRDIHVDSGAARVECVLLRPRGVVPVHLSSGVAGVRIRRPPGVAVVADISPGALQLKLDAFRVAATTTETHWESVRGAAERDHYRLRISGGCVRVTLEEDPSIEAGPVDARPPAGRSGVTAALELVLDGVASRAAGRGPGGSP